MNSLRFLMYKFGQNAYQNIKFKEVTMERKPSINKKALGVLGLMIIGANASNDMCDGKVANYKEANCNKYDHKTGVCLKCS